MQNSIFISYNPNSARERQLAQDLYKKGKQNGFFIYLPERTHGDNLTYETRNRIDNAEWFVIFSTVPLSRTVADEVNYAIQRGKEPNKIIIIYSRQLGRNITGNTNITDRFISFDIDDYDLNSIEKLKNDIFLRISQNITTNAQRRLQQTEDTNTALKVILGIGIAALLLGAINGNNR